MHDVFIQIIYFYYIVVFQIFCFVVVPKSSQCYTYEVFPVLELKPKLEKYICVTNISFHLIGD